MGFALTEYIKIKNNYCVCYFGHDASYLVQLRILRPYIEQALPELRLTICCNDQYVYLFEGEPRVIGRSQVVDRKKEFAFIRELTSDNSHHIIERFLEESKIPIPALPQDNKDGICLVCPEGLPPTKSVPTQKLTDYAKKLGYDPVVVGSDINVSMNEIANRPSGEERLKLAKGVRHYIGVETDLLYLSGFYGAKTTLVPTGIGTSMYKKMFPKGLEFVLR